MKKTYTLIGFMALGVAATAATGIICEIRKRKRNLLNRLSEASDEGYELAHDIIYPDKYSKSKNLRYGPVF